MLKMIKDFLTLIGVRFRSKLGRLSAAVPVLLGALAVTAVLAMTAWAVLPYLPPGMRRLIDHMADGGFEQGKAEVKAVFDLLGGAKVWAFLGVQLLQVLLAPIPGQFTNMLGGFLFGFWPGLALNLLGNGTGSWLAMFLTRVFGRRLLGPFVSAASQAKFDAVIDRGGVENFFMIFLLPAMPKDSTCFMAGLTRLPLWKLLGACVLGRAPGIAVLTFAGASIDADILTAKIVFGIGMTAAFFAWIFEEELKDRLRRWIAPET